MLQYVFFRENIMKNILSAISKFFQSPRKESLNLNAKSKKHPGGYVVVSFTYNNDEYQIVPGNQNLKDIIAHLNGVTYPNQIRVDEDRDYIHIDNEQYNGQKI